MGTGSFVRTDVIARAALLGAAAGARSATPLAALAQRTGNPWVRAAAAAGAAGELIADKLPGTPSRLRPAPLGGRLVLGGLAGFLYARRNHTNVVLPTIAAAATAVGASYAGAAWRAFAAQHHFAVPAALLEDAAALIVAATVANDDPLPPEPAALTNQP